MSRKAVVLTSAVLLILVLCATFYYVREGLLSNHQGSGAVAAPADSPPTVPAPSATPPSAPTPAPEVPAPAAPSVASIQPGPAASPAPTAADNASTVTFMTWNLRGYPEKDPARCAWFSGQLLRLKPAILCVQEIANKGRVDTFLAAERGFSWAAFVDSSDGQDNAIFGTPGVGREDLADPQGFQHPAQAAYVWTGGFDAVVVTVHLSWTDVSLREKEKALLRGVVTEMLKKDPDVMVTGDFNTKEQGIEELAQAIGLKVMVPAGQDGVGTTHAGNRYDHFLVSPDLASEEAVDCRIETFSGADLATAAAVSDHLPVTARFRTDEKFRDRVR